MNEMESDLTVDVYEIDANIKRDGTHEWTIKPFTRFLSIASMSRNGGLKIAFGRTPWYVNKDKFDTNAVFAVGDVFISVFSKGKRYDEDLLKYNYIQVKLEQNGRIIVKAQTMIDQQKFLISNIDAENKVLAAITPPPF